MKRIMLSFIMNCFFAIHIFSQVGIGTTEPASSSILDITSTDKGVLIPRVKLVGADDKSPLTGNIPDGTLVFNTDKSGVGDNSVIPGVYVWKNNRWVFPGALGVTQSKAIKFTNSTSSSTNLNPSSVATPVDIDIFNTEVFNDDPSVFEKINGYQLIIKEAGLYLVSVNLALKQSPAVGNSRLSNYIYLNLDGSLASSKIITLVPQYNPNDIDIDGRFAFGSNSYMNVEAGQILTLHSQRYKDGDNYNGTLKFDETSLSSVTLIKIQ